MSENVKYYEPKEEKLNVLTHFIGLVLSVIGTGLLVVKASLYEDVWHIVSFSVFGGSMVLLYTASTLYHSAKAPRLRARLNIFDHASIYVLIAGTYTPYTLVTLHGTMGWVLFGIVWTAAVVGVILKFFYIGKYKKISTAMYIIMGWVVLIAIQPMIENLAIAGLIWLGIGGLSYTVGAIFYMREKIAYNHAVFHVFGLLGSFCHFVSIYFYV